MRALNGVDLQGVALARRGVVAVVGREGGALGRHRGLGRHRLDFRRRRFDAGTR